MSRLKENRAIITDEIINKLKKNDIIVGAKVKFGKKGTVYEIKNELSKVLKITNDESEAIASNHIKRKKFKNVVNIYDVFKFRDIPSYYFIVQEKLESIDIGEKLVWNTKLMNTAHIDDILQQGKEIILFAKNKNINKLEFPNLYKYLKSKDGIRTLLHGIIWMDEQFAIEYNLISDEDNHNEICQYLEDAIIEFETDEYFSKFYQLSNGMKELDAQGIYFYDAHPGNIMQRKDGTLVIIDLGLSQSPKEKMEVLESKN